MSKNAVFFINFIITETILLLVFAVIEPFNLWFYFLVQAVVVGLLYLDFEHKKGNSEETELNSKSEKVAPEKVVHKEIVPKKIIPKKRKPKAKKPKPEVKYEKIIPDEIDDEFEIEPEEVAPEFVSEKAKSEEIALEKIVPKKKKPKKKKPKPEIKYEKIIPDEIEDEFKIAYEAAAEPEIDYAKIWEDIENEAFDLFDIIPPIPVHTKRETFGYINRLCENITKYRKNNPKPINPNSKEILSQIRSLAEVMDVMKSSYNSNPKLIEQRVHYIVRLITL